ncbi:MAG: hypothetical protein ACYDEB_06600 [Dehalococcoidia bacterium]
MATKPLIILARHKYLLLIPFLVILPLAILLTVATRSKDYASRSTIWVQPPIFLPAAQSQGSQYLTPAQNQANALNEQLATDSFAQAVATTLSAAGVPATAASVRTGTSVFANGYYSLIVERTSRSAARAQAIVQGIVSQYQADYLANTTQQAKTAANFYTAQLTTQQQTLQKARDALGAYAQQHTSIAANATDPQYLALQGAVQQAQNTYNTTQNNLYQVTLSSGSTLEALQQSIKVVDPASLPETPVKVSLRKQMLFPVAGLLLAVSLSAAVYAFLLRTDNSIRVAEDLQALPGLALLGTVPDVSAVKKRGWPKHFFRLAVTALGVSLQR